MLNLPRLRRIGVGAIPANLTVLSVSWLNQQVKAIAVHRGAVAGQWENPAQIEASADFEALIREAVQNTGFRGQTVSLLLAHPRLVQQLVEVPPVKGAVLRKILRRQAEQQKLFAGEAVWAVQASPMGGGNQSVILHLFPKALLDQLAEGCKRNGLHLTAVIPAAAVLHSQLLELPLEKEETALLAGETAGATTVVVGRRNGQIFLARTLPSNWNDGLERLALDVSRTILFANQQYSIPVDSGVWLFGARAGEHTAALERQIQLPVKVSPVEWTPFYWATESLKLPPELSPNFIRPEQQNVLQRRTFAKAVAVSTLFVVAVCLAATVYSSLAARQESANIKALSAQLTKLEDRRQELQRRNGELARKEQVVKLVSEERPPPVPVWLFAYLGEATPSELAITNLSVIRSNDVWRVRLAGAFQGTNEFTPAAMSRSVGVLSARLTGRPFYLKPQGGLVNQSETAAPAKSSATDSSIPDWVRTVTGGQTGKVAAASQPIQDGFLIEGVIK